MLSVVASLCAGLVVLAAGLKLADRMGAAIALSTYGIGGMAARLVVWALIGWEILLAATLLAGVPTGAAAAAVTFGVFAVAQAIALAIGRGGLPCGCMGGAGRLSVWSVSRVFGLGAVCAVLALDGGFSPLADAPLAVAIAMSASAFAFVALNRRKPTGALEIASEGPALGEPTALADWLPAPDGRLRLVVFTSASCRLCSALGPAMTQIIDEGRVVLRTFEAERDREVWQSIDVPGAPYAVVVAADGTAVAKGTINTGEQLANLVIAAHERVGMPVITTTGADSRRDFLGKATATAGALAVGTAVTALVKPGDAQAFHICGHIYTTDGCPHPTGLSRIDSRGKPLRAWDGKRVDDLGRLIDDAGLPIDEAGRAMIDPDGRRLPPATRTAVCLQAARKYGIKAQTDGSWYRCCGGHIRKLTDCCSSHKTRINGDPGLTGYCDNGRKVFCVLYFDTKVKC